MKSTGLLLVLLALPIFAPAADTPPAADAPARPLTKQDIGGRLSVKVPDYNGAAAPVVSATTRVEGTFVVPKDLPAFAGRVAEIRLYKTDPRIADRAATLVEMVTLPDISHAAGVELSRTFSIGASGTLDPTATYYVTFFLLADGKRTHIGEGDHSKNNLCKVLTAGQPSKITIRLREVKN